MKNFLNYFASKMILLNVLQNLGIYLFCFAHYGNSSEKSNFLVLHNFTKCFSGTQVNQIVNKCLNG